MYPRGYPETDYWSCEILNSFSESYLSGFATCLYKQ